MVFLLLAGGGPLPAAHLDERAGMALLATLALGKTVLLLVILLAVIALVPLWRGDPWQRHASAARNWLIVWVALQATDIASPVLLWRTSFGIAKALIALQMIAWSVAYLFCFVGVFVKLTAMGRRIAGFCRTERLRRWSEHARTAMLLLIWPVFLVPLGLIVVGYTGALDWMTREQALWLALGLYGAAVVLLFYMLVRVFMMLALTAITLRNAAANPPEYMPPTHTMPTFIPPRPKDE